mmetsp:Transcript_12424/g.30948  ORF Transcript_12424/g.30948 Transcript_12424/m.30948 type:complete len:251 (+) Transcript_12424:4037-4789(+)
MAGRDGHLVQLGLLLAAFLQELPRLLQLRVLGQEPREEFRGDSEPHWERHQTKNLGAHHVVLERLEGMDEKLRPLRALVKAHRRRLRRQLEHAREERGELVRVRGEGGPRAHAFAELEVCEDDERHEVLPRRGGGVEVRQQVPLQVARELEREQRVGGRARAAVRLSEELVVDGGEQRAVEAAAAVGRPVSRGERLDPLLAARAGARAGGGGGVGRRRGRAALAALLPPLLWRRRRVRRAVPPLLRRHLF